MGTLTIPNEDKALLAGIAVAIAGVYFGNTDTVIAGLAIAGVGKVAGSISTSETKPATA